jgi:hypothetical protein
MENTVKELMESKIIPAKKLYGDLIALSLINNYEDSNTRYQLLKEFIKLGIKVP